MFLTARAINNTLTFHFINKYSVMAALFTVSDGHFYASMSLVLYGTFLSQFYSNLLTHTFIIKKAFKLI